MAIADHSLQQVLRAYGFENAELELVEIGNINKTYRLTVGGRRLILQRLNPVFGASVHHDIEAVTRHIAARGLQTPTLVRTTSGALWAEDPFGGVWRVLTLVEGQIYSSAATPVLCRSAAQLLGRFHVCVADLEHDFHSQRPGVHDTARHLAHLRTVLRTRDAHAAYAEVARVSQVVLAASGDLPTLRDLPPRVVHGDPKLNNVVFDGDTAISLIDLDTLSTLSIPVELGDAFRSWCNRSGEDEIESEFDLACFRAGLAGYAEAAGDLLEPREVRAIAPAVEIITLELAARFCADALEESYFAWNRQRFESASAHNLYRARSQLSLAQSYARQRQAAREAVERALGD